MSGALIQSLIKSKNEELEKMGAPKNFTLDVRVFAILQEIRSLQDQCEHEFTDGRCVWCGITQEAAANAVNSL